MGKASSSKNDGSRREKIAEQRAAARRAERRRRLLLAGVAVVVVIGVVVGLVVAKLNSKPSASAGHAPAGPTGPALSQLIHKTTSVPPATFHAVGTGKVNTKPQAISGHPAPLTSNGKPEVLYLGAEFCPYCAAERWPMVVALSRFGSFSGLRTTHSASANGAGTAEPFPNLSTWSFFGSRYSSPRLAFTAVETNTNIPDPKTGGYTTLQTPTPQQQALLTKYDAPPYIASQNAGSIPFVNLGNKYLAIGSSFSPDTLQGLSWNQIAADLHNPSTPVAQSVLGTANYFTAMLCGLTGNQPGNVCTPAITALQHQI